MTNTANPDEDSKKSIQKWELISSCYVTATDKLTDFAGALKQKGFGTKDSIHIACAVESKAKFFFTVDNGILKKRNLIKEIRIVNPVEFIAIEEKI